MALADARSPRHTTPIRVRFVLDADGHPNVQVVGTATSAILMQTRFAAPAERPSPGSSV